MTFDPASVEVTCVILPMDPIHIKICVCGYSEYFSKTLTKKVNNLNDPKMTFNPTSIKVTCATIDYLRIVVSISHKNTSKHTHMNTARVDDPYNLTSNDL